MLSPPEFIVTLRETFAARVREHRTRNGWSLRDCGLSFNPPVSAVHVHHLERGDYNPTLEQVEKVAAALGLNDPRKLLR